MSDKPGVRINGEFYPFVDKFKHGDPILIYEVTGLEWERFAELLFERRDAVPAEDEFGGVVQEFAQGLAWG